MWGFVVGVGVLERRRTHAPDVSCVRRRVRYRSGPLRAGRGLGREFEGIGQGRDELDDIMPGEDDDDDSDWSNGDVGRRKQTKQGDSRPKPSRKAILTSFDDDDEDFPSEFDDDDDSIEDFEDDDDDDLDDMELDLDGKAGSPRMLRRQSYDVDASGEDDEDEEDDDDDEDYMDETDSRITSRPGEGKVYFEPLDDDESGEDKPAPRKKRPYSAERARLGGQIVVTGDPRFWGRVCSGCGGIIGEAYDQDGNDVLMKAGSARDLNINWRKVSRTRDITKKATCSRCELLKEGDITSALRALKDINPDVFRNQIRQLAAKPVFVVKVIDAMDFDGSWINNLRDLIGKNPVILAVTKVDLLVDQRDVEGRLKLMRWCDGRMRLKGLNCLASYAVSGKTGFGVSDLAEFLLESIKGRNVYVVGYANAGKSTLINRLKDEIMSKTFYSGTQGYMRKMELAKTGVTISRLPGTTLKSVRIPCFKSHKHAIWDTPGIIVPRYEFPTLEEQRVELMQEEPARIVPMEFEIDPSSILVVDNNLVQLEILPKGSSRRCSTVHVKWYSTLTSEVQKLRLTDAMMNYPRTQPGDKVNRTTPRLIKEFTPERSMLGKGGVDADIVIHNLGFFAVWASYPDFKVRLYGPGAVQPCIRPCIPIPDYSRRDSDHTGSGGRPARDERRSDPFRARGGFSGRDPRSDGGWTQEKWRNDRPDPRDDQRGFRESYPRRAPSWNDRESDRRGQPSRREPQEDGYRTPRDQPDSPPRNRYEGGRDRSTQNWYDEERDSRSGRAFPRERADRRDWQRNSQRNRAFTQDGPDSDYRRDPRPDRGEGDWRSRGQKDYEMGDVAESSRRGIESDNIDMDGVPEGVDGDEFSVRQGYGNYPASQSPRGRRQSEEYGSRPNRREPTRARGQAATSLRGAATGSRGEGREPFRRSGEQRTEPDGFVEGEILGDEQKMERPGGRPVYLDREDEDFGDRRMRGGEQRDDRRGRPRTRGGERQSYERRETRDTEWDDESRRSSQNFADRRSGFRGSRPGPARNQARDPRADDRRGRAPDRRREAVDDEWSSIGEDELSEMEASWDFDG